MNLKQALKDKKIRYARGSEFSEEHLGYFILMQEAEDREKEIERLVYLNSIGEGYLGGVFVTLDEELPPCVPLNTPEHCWATALASPDFELLGAVIAWSDDENEKKYIDAKKVQEKARTVPINFLY